jgi:hypothetical protein
VIIHEKLVQEVGGGGRRTPGQKIGILEKYMIRWILEVFFTLSAMPLVVRLYNVWMFYNLRSNQ